MREIEVLKERYLGSKLSVKVGTLKEDIEYFKAVQELNLLEEDVAEELQERLQQLSGLIQEADDEDTLTQDEEDEGPPEDEEFFSEGPPEESEEDKNLSFDTEPEETPEDLGDEEETFGNKYPEVDGAAVLQQSYNDWLENISRKPFYKVIEGFYSQKLSGSLNYLERGFLWKFMKSISSAITHLLIEGEQKEEAIYLVQKYYDSLSACLDKVIHAADKEDVIQAFDFMVEFLGILSEDGGEEESEREEF